MRFYHLLLLFILSVPAAARKPSNDYFSHFNTDAFWQKLVEEPAGPPIILRPGDTAIAIASNRATAPGSLRFMSEDRDTAGTVRYYIAYTRDGQWRVRRRPSLRAVVADMMQPQRDWVIYAEGMGKIFTTDLDRGLSLAGQYSVNLLLLDYPSIHSGYNAYKNYRFVLRNSTRAYKDFAPALDSFRRLRAEGVAGEGKLTLFFHSMGNNIIRRIAQTSYLKRYNDDVWVDNLVLNAPCVPTAGSTEWIERIRFARNIYVHYNPHDFTLKWARLGSLHAILGERPEPPLARNAAYINFNPLCGASHSNFLNLWGRPPVLPEAVAHYKKLFHGQPVNLKDPSLYAPQEDGMGWYITGDGSKSMGIRETQRSILKMRRDLRRSGSAQ